MYGRFLSTHFFLSIYIEKKVRILNIVLVAEKKSIIISYVFVPEIPDCLKVAKTEKISNTVAHIP